MRLWSLHPRYLDPRGLVAVWREGLLAQAVLRGKTQGYKRHPQLLRFRAQTSPVGCLGAYLRGVLAEAERRGYDFDDGKISRMDWRGHIPCTDGQLQYEWAHLRRKLEARDVNWLREIGSVGNVESHPLFRTVPGPVAEWERLK
jgi:Pyrimidine dimer DNA glycosylase